MSASGIHIEKIAVVMLGVKDVQRALKFYRDVLGLKMTAQFEGFAFFDAGGMTLALSEALAKHTGQGAGATEVVFAVDGVRDHYEALCQRGVEFTHEPRVVTGTQWAANFCDLDGHRLSIFGTERRSQGASA